MSLGEKWQSMLGSVTKEQAFELLDAFVEAGGNTIDTANIYQVSECDSQGGHGLTRWTTGRGQRDLARRILERAQDPRP